MAWGEAIRLAEELVKDPASHVFAARAGWDYPLSREVLVLADLFDLQHRANAKTKPKPYPRPWLAPDKRRHGQGKGMSPAQLRAAFAAVETRRDAAGRLRDARGRFVRRQR